MTQLPALLTTEEAAAALRVHPETLRRWARDGEIESVDLPGRTVRFRRSDIERILVGPAADAAPAPVADAGFSALDATFPAAAVLAAVFLALALPGGTAAALAVLAVIVGVGVRQMLAAHARGLARLARHDVTRGRRDRVAAIAVRRLYTADRAPAVIDVRIDPRMTDAVAARLLADIARGGAR